MKIILDPDQVWSLRDLPPRSIALDGACPGPAIDAEHERYSFDHHADCIRLVTTATCQQVLDALVLGLDPTGHEVYANDVDADVVLSVWLLQHHQRWRHGGNLQRVRPLVWAIGATDAHGPSYLAPHADLARTLYRWVLLPLVRARAADPGRPPSRHLLDACVERLDAWWIDGLESRAVSNREPPTRRVEDHGTWIMVEPEGGAGSIGVHALYEEGHDRLVIHTPRGDGTHRYTLARRSDLVAGFPLPALYEALNTAEAERRGDSLDPAQRWGGGSAIGGSPRDGSRLPPEQVAAVIAEILTSDPWTGS